MSDAPKITKAQARVLEALEAGSDWVKRDLIDAMPYVPDDDLWTVTELINEGMVRQRRGGLLPGEESFVGLKITDAGRAALARHRGETT